MSNYDMLKCLIAFILGWLACKMMANGACQCKNKCNRNGVCQCKK